MNFFLLLVDIYFYLLWPTSFTFLIPLQILISIIYIKEIKLYNNKKWIHNITSYHNKIKSNCKIWKSLLLDWKFWAIKKPWFAKFYDVILKSFDVERYLPKGMRGCCKGERRKISLLHFILWKEKISIKW